MNRFHHTGRLVRVNVRKYHTDDRGRFVLENHQDLLEFQLIEEIEGILPARRHRLPEYFCSPFGSRCLNEYLFRDIRAASCRRATLPFTTELFEYMLCFR